MGAKLGPGADLEENWDAFLLQKTLDWTIVFTTVCYDDSFHRI